MDVQQSPPKRMTRARAAAKANDASLKTTKVVTAAAKAKTTRSTTTTTTRTTTATKRKTRPDEAELDDELNMPEEQSAPAPSSAMRSTRATRARAKKAPEPEAEEAPAPAKATRGRPKKVVQEAVKEEPVRTGRTRAARKVHQDEEPDEMLAEPAKKPTRGRPPIAKPATTKKTVTFEEPEKENVIPTNTKAKAANSSESGTGMRARPVRKPATRATRASAKAAPPAEEKEKDKKSPLSPKKVTQMPVCRDSGSDDELAAIEKTPLKALMRSPVKPPTNISTPKKPQDTEAINGTEHEVAKHSGLVASLALGTPARRLPNPLQQESMKSPAKRLEGFASLTESSARPAGQPAQLPNKVALLTSPAKRPQSPIKALMSNKHGVENPSQSVFKASLLQSPAKRPQSPIKLPPSMQRPEPVDGNQSPNTKPLLLTTPAPPTLSAHGSRSLKLDEQEEAAGDDEDILPESPSRLMFPGRLSAVLPRHADPAFKPASAAVNLPVDEEAQAPEGAEEPAIEKDDESINVDAVVDYEPMALDEPNDVEEMKNLASTPTPISPSKKAIGSFGLRQKDLDPYVDMDSDSDDELAPRMIFSKKEAQSSTPGPLPMFKTPKTQCRSSNPTTKKAKTDDIGFTPLAKQLSEWNAASAKPGLVSAFSSVRRTDHADDAMPEQGNHTPHVEQTPTSNTFFEDEMLVRDETSAPEEAEAAMEDEHAAEIEDPVFDSIPLTDEDFALAAEANEMSLFEPSYLAGLDNEGIQDDAISEASQEYGDENAIPVDPRIANSRLSAQSSTDVRVPPHTPVRHIAREFHTVSKVPLKPADSSTPRPVKKRSASISRLPVQRPKGLTRNATVISYSPMKEPSAPVATRSTPESAPATPSKSEIWSLAGTPAQTPRREVNPALLRGAVVFVDVHTTEGADASGIFIELLNQMGARCVKTWTWNPNSESGSESTSKVGITHVVYKDGGKRTMEKVRQSNGIVQCVGVSWVLDCERENEWLDEAPYYIDTSLVPRGGARRRKSMEPKALANLNGLMVPTPMRNSNQARECLTAPSTPVGSSNRRASALWIRTPEDEHEVDNENDFDWDNSMLTPVPKTPAPEAIAKFAADLTPDTPSEYSDMDSFDDQAALLMQTCPPKSSIYYDLGEGILEQDKDERVLLRLMAARRKSLQFAPKVASPLSKAWN